ncbi:MAG: hypothetical protein R2699_08780 [Acidimicrobiales bacterium]
MQSCAQHGGQQVRRRQPVAGELDGEARHRHADGHLVQPDLRRDVGTDPGIGRHQDDGAHGQGVTGGAEHDRLGEFVDAQRQLAARPQQVAGRVHAALHDGEVEAGRELALASDDGDGADGGIALGLVECGVQRVDHGVGDGVGLAVVDGHHEGGAVDGGGHGVRSVGHGRRR